MKLVETRVKKFRNIIDSTSVNISKDITCLVGKNESGKTAFLHSLYRMNPVRKNVSFISEDQYPAWMEKKDRLKGIDLKSEIPIEAKFVLEDPELEELTTFFGEGVLEKPELILSKNYGNTLFFSLSLNEKLCIKNILKDLSFSKDTRADISKCQNLEELNSFITAFVPSEESEDKDKESISELKKRINNLLNESKDLSSAIFTKLTPYIPQFIYFDKYSSLPYTVKILDVLKTPEQNLSDDLLTARSLLRMAAADDDYLLNPDYER
jgi:predicted ATP-dependent endonuclease of OLD family